MAVLAQVLALALAEVYLLHLAACQSLLVTSKRDGSLREASRAHQRGRDQRELIATPSECSLSQSLARRRSGAPCGAPNSCNRRDGLLSEEVEENCID